MELLHMDLHPVGLAVIAGVVVAASATGAFGYMNKAARLSEGTGVALASYKTACPTFDADRVSAHVRAGQLAEAQKLLNARRDCNMRTPRPYDPLG